MIVGKQYRCYLITYSTWVHVDPCSNGESWFEQPDREFWVTTTVYTMNGIEPTRGQVWRSLEPLGYKASKYRLFSIKTSNLR